MNKACVYVLLLASFAVTSCAQKIQYPEAYGTYIKDGGKFSRLEINTPQEAQRNFTASASIVVFDRRLASPLVQPKEAITLFNRHYVRFNVDLVQLKAEGEIVERHISKAGDFANLGSSLGLDVYPIPGHPDMLEFKPVGNFRAGLYTLLVDQQKYAFAIGLGGKTDAESEHNGMVDRYFEVTPKRGGFTFEEFGKASERGPFAKNYRDNYFIQKEYYKSSAALDGEVRHWRENFESNINSQNYLGCMNIIECLDAFDGTGLALKAGLFDSMAAGLRKDLDIDPLFVAARSAQFMRMEPLVQAFRDINEVATKRIKEINSKSSNPIDEERKTRLLNSILYVSQPLPKGNEKELIGKLEIFEDGIVDHFYQDGVPKKFVTDLAGISIGAHSDFRHIRGFFDEHPKQYYVLEFSKSGANGSYHFHSARERDDASAALQKAVNQFKSKLDLHDKVTAGNVSMEVDGEAMVYVVKSVPYLWSPVINLPDNCAAVYWKQIEPNRIMGGPDDIEIQLQNGKIVDRTQIPSGNGIRIRSAENEGEITGKLYIVLGPTTRVNAAGLHGKTNNASRGLSTDSSSTGQVTVSLHNGNTSINWTAKKAVLGRSISVGGGWGKESKITGKAILGNDGSIKELAATIGVATVWTESDVLTNIMRDPKTGFFLLDKHPLATFNSTAITASASTGLVMSNATHTVEGNFQLNGIERSIRFPARINTVEATLEIFAEFSINRKDFDCRLSSPPAGVLLADRDLSDDITVLMQIKDEVPSGASANINMSVGRDSKEKFPDRQGLQSAYTETIEVYKVDFDMVLVPGDETTGIKPLYVGRQEVTWEEFLPWVTMSDVSDPSQAGKLRAKKLRPDLPPWDVTRGYGTNNYPALGMTRLSAEMYCAWLSDYTAKKYRLPTEREWEHIIIKANLGKTELTSTEKVKGIAVYEKNSWMEEVSDYRPKPCQTMGPDALGIYDLVGNVAEWVTDTGEMRVVRGGHYVSPILELGLRGRLVEDLDSWNKASPDGQKNLWWFADAPWVGFRIVCEP